MKRVPKPVAKQIRAVVAESRRILGRDLVGIYLHGSLALGGFNLKTSDIDLLVITTRPIGVAGKVKLIRVLLDRSRRPAPMEISFVTRAQLRPWRHPARFDLHFSESWRNRFERDPRRAIAAQRNSADPDLAAHLTVVRARGVRLFGEPIANAIPAIPERDYVDSLLSDFRWALRRMDENPRYFVLNACRFLAYLREGRIMSKDEGGRWALRRLPTAHRLVTRSALKSQRSGSGSGMSARALEAFARYMKKEIPCGLNR